MGISAEAVLANLVGLRIFVASHAADMREFGLTRPDVGDDSQSPEWYLHIQCPWRMESAGRIITGSLDWFEPFQAAQDTGEGWDPATGGSLQELKLRKVFGDLEEGRTIRNRTGNLVVADVSANGFGDLVIVLTGGFRLLVFPSGSRGEFWRVFKKDDLTSHFVWEGESDTDNRA